MAKVVKYIKDHSGQKTSVIVPVGVWDELNANYKKLERKLKIMNDILRALAEVRHSGKTGRPLQTLNEFLSENHH